MARPVKNNADYFSHDNDMRNDERVKAVRRKFKHEGYSIWNMMLEKLSKADGFTLKYNPMNLELWAGDFEIETERLSEILEYFLKIELLMIIDGEIFSENMIRRFSGLTDKRNKRREKFRAVETPKVEVSDGCNPQSKGEESKPKERKVNKSKINNNKETVSPDGASENPDPEKPKTLHHEMIAVYDSFLQKKMGVPAKINGQEGKAIKEIIEYFRRGKDPTDEGILHAWEYLLGAWDRLDTYNQGKLKPSEINSNMVNIINQIKNGKGNNKAAQWANHFAAKTGTDN